MARQQRGEETVQRLLDVALAVFAKDGASGFTVQAITAASGVSLGSLYHHFGSMDGLAAALYARSMGALLDALVGSLSRARTARAGIAAIVTSYLAFTRDRADEARFIHASAYAAFLPAHAADIAAVKAPRIEAILAWARPHVRAGRMVALPPPVLEALVIGPVAEVARRWLAGAPGFSLEEAERLLPERIWRSVRRDA